MPNIDALAMLTAQDPGDTITASAAGSTVIDLLANRDLGVGDPVKVIFQVLAAFTDAGSDSTVAVTLETSDDNVTFALAQSLGTFAALSAIGTKLEAYLQPGAINKRYLRAQFTVANGNLTTGKIAGWLSDTFDHNVAYPTGTVIA